MAVVASCTSSVEQGDSSPAASASTTTNIGPSTDEPLFEDGGTYELELIADLTNYSTMSNDPTDDVSVTGLWAWGPQFDWTLDHGKYTADAVVGSQQVGGVWRVTVDFFYRNQDDPIVSVSANLGSRQLTFEDVSLSNRGYTQWSASESCDGLEFSEELPMQITAITESGTRIQASPFFDTTALEGPDESLDTPSPCLYRDTSEFGL